MPLAFGELSGIMKSLFGSVSLCLRAAEAAVRILSSAFLYNLEIFVSIANSAISIKCRAAVLSRSNWGPDSLAFNCKSSF